MRMISRRRTLGYAAAFFISFTAIVAASSRGESAGLVPATSVAPPPAMFDGPAEAIAFADDSLRGRSGKLLARFVVPSVRSSASNAFAEIFGADSLEHPGVYPVQDHSLSRPLAFIAMYPFSAKDGATLGAYRIGYWPGERMRVSNAYANPLGFVEVTRENEDTRVSEHFRLRDFLTHDQRAVWPKYLVLREELVDKLELVIAELEREGHPVKHMTVMSGFRTPQYNATGGNTAGRAELSRHMYGDASDVFVDNNADGRMDDLNGDGRIDFRDAQVILRAEERVEAAHHDLIGGGGVYKATSSHGPFAHIDVRGHRSRWGLVE
jgi:hypothetical protein